MTVAQEQAMQTELSITQCRRNRAEPSLAHLAERKLDFTLALSVYETRWDEKAGLRTGCCKLFCDQKCLAGVQFATKAGMIFRQLSVAIECVGMPGWVESSRKRRRE